MTGGHGSRPAGANHCAGGNHHFRNLIIGGGAAFNGSHLAEHLLTLGEEVIVWDELSTGRMANLQRCVGRPRFRCIIGDFTHDTTSVPPVETADIVNHLAAAVGVQLIVSDPVRTTETNIKSAEVAASLAPYRDRPLIVLAVNQLDGRAGRVSRYVGAAYRVQLPRFIEVACVRAAALLRDSTTDAVIVRSPQTCVHWHGSGQVARVITRSYLLLVCHPLRFTRVVLEERVLLASRRGARELDRPQAALPTRRLR
jgi:hypothetical protein